MFSDLQKRKLERYFNVIDYDHNGTIEAEDFEAIARNLAGVRNWAEGTPGYDSVRAGVLSIWAMIQQSADMNRDGKASLAEWMAS